MTTSRTILGGAGVALLALALSSSTLFARIDGITGRSTSGCGCHGSANSGITVTISGPQSVEPLSTHSYTVTVSGGPAGGLGGFDLKASAGTLTAGSNNHVSGTEVTHNNENSRSWTFSWTAPATIGNQNFVATGLAADGGQDTGGDAWYYYGGASNSQFVINVNNPVGVSGTPSTLWIAPPVPNPCRRETVVEFSLPSAGDVSVEILDVSGRHVATLMRAALPAGHSSVRWDRRADNGSRAVAGLYFVRLARGSESITTRLLIVD
jgi:hypothetical protein